MGSVRKAFDLTGRPPLIIGERNDRGCRRRKAAAGAPLRRPGDGDDLKGAAVLFASDAGKHITGQILAADGGLTALLSSA